MYICICKDSLFRAIGLKGRVFTNGQGDWGSSQIDSYQRLKNGIWSRLPYHSAL